MTDRDLFIAALELDDPAARRAYLEDACGDDSARRQRVEALFQVYENAGSFLESPPAAATATMTPASSAEVSGTVVGPYKLLEVIGEGGMGTVFMAEQTQPVRRKVALKVIKAGMDSRQVLARFGAERQALALMDHPNIAKVLEAGATEQGRPYFVMELVKGVPITRYCDEKRLTPRERLELFIPVCQAVQHAHQKGIIHRDLKPSNVLVGLYDGVPVPKIIDFGVAKATGPKLTEATLFTGFGTVVGTPEYMSPEQAHLDNLDIDTRSDIYSLGVLLYELLTGTTPLGRTRLNCTALLEILRVIREEEPLRPSTRLSTTEELPSIAASRNVEPRKLKLLVRGELDWIVMKCLEKDRTRRYVTSNELATDLRRQLDDEPVQACPPSPAYRLVKFARRNKGAFLTGIAVALALLLGVAILAASNALIRQEQVRTRDEKDRAERAWRLAEGRSEQIRRDLDRLKRANTLIQSGRFCADGQDWARAHADLSKAVELRPDHSLGRFERADLYTRLGLWDLAVRDFDEAFRLHRPPTPIRWTHYALLSLFIGETDRYQRICRGLPGQFDQEAKYLEWGDALTRAYTLAPLPDADRSWMLRVAERALQRRPANPWNHHALGIAHYRAGDDERAVHALQESLRLDPRSAAVVTSNSAVLAMAYHRLGRAEEARQALGTAARRISRMIELWSDSISRGSVGPTLTQWFNEDLASLRWWDWMPCLILYREAEALIGNRPPPDDPRLFVCRARAFAALNDKYQAGAACAKAVSLQPENVPVRLACHEICVGLGLREAPAVQANAGLTQGPAEWNILGVARYRAGDWKAAIEALEKSVALAPDNYVAFNGFFLAMSHWQLGEREAARKSYDQAVAWMDKNAPTDEKLLRCRHEAAVLLGRKEAIP
jgi:serine/threonine protein kinase/Tfp pilus assembly protein PilF